MTSLPPEREVTAPAKSDHMDKYSNNFAECTSDAENNQSPEEAVSAYDADMAALDELERDIGNMNGGRGLEETEHGAAMREADLEKMFAELDKVAAENADDHADTACTKSSPKRDAAACTKSSQSTRRKSRTRDRDFINGSRAYETAINGASGGASLEASPPLSNKFPTTTYSTLNTTPPDTPRSSNDNTPTPPRWDEATPLLKCAFLHRAVAQRGGISFTLNLGPDVEKSARAAEKGFTRYMAKRLQRSLEGALGHPVPLWFAVDVTKEGRPHLHGGLVAAPEALPAVENALSHAGGKWGSVRGSRHQCLVNDRLDDAWAEYATKTVSPSRQEALGSMASATHDLRRIARNLFDEWRDKFSFPAHHAVVTRI